MSIPVWCFFCIKYIIHLPLLNQYFHHTANKKIWVILTRSPSTDILAKYMRSLKVMFDKLKSLSLKYLWRLKVKFDEVRSQNFWSCIIFSPFKLSLTRIQYFGMCVSSSIHKYLCRKFIIIWTKQSALHQQSTLQCPI